MDKLLQLLTSYKTTIVLLVIYAIGLATATFVEKQMSTEAAKNAYLLLTPIYFLQFLMVANFLLILLKNNYIKHKKWAMIVIHVALIVILGGALTNFLFGKKDR